MAKRLKKDTELVKVLSGKASEPKHTGLMYSKMDLARALNHYSAHAKPDSLKQWAMIWVHKNCPELVKRLSPLPSSCFLTYGALARLDERGYQHSPEMVERMKDYFRTVQPVRHEDSEEVPAAPKAFPKAKRNAPSRSFDSLDAALDALMIGQDGVAVSLDPKESMVEIKAYCERELKALKDHPDQYLAHHHSKLVKFFKAQLERIEKIATVKKAKAPVVQSKRANPAKIVAGVKYQRSDDESGLTSINPIDTLERRKMFVYDTKYRRLIMFVATPAGFTFTGTTLQNVDLKRSSFKTVRKPAELNKVKKYTITEMNKVFDALKTKETPVTTGRFNSNFLIVKVTDKGN